jgi:hypothetical protein
MMATPPARRIPAADATKTQLTEPLPGRRGARGCTLMSSGAGAGAGTCAAGGDAGGPFVVSLMLAPQKGHRVTPTALDAPQLAHVAFPVIAIPPRC